MRYLFYFRQDINIERKNLMQGGMLMMEVLHWLGNQFSNLLDPGTALGAFLISCAASWTCTFIGGMKWKEHTIKKNKILSDEIKGSIYQDISTKVQGDSNSEQKTSKRNSIKVKNVDGDVWQDSKK